MQDSLDSEVNASVDEERQRQLATRSPLLWKNSRKIQRLSDCHHFHYPLVELGPIVVRLKSVESNDENTSHPKCTFEIDSNGHSWNIIRSLAEVVEFDRQLHRCVFERKHSKLEEIEFDTRVMADGQIKNALEKYMDRLSQLTGSIITCYPVLKFLEIDCRGNRFEPVEETSINVTAIAAAVVTKDFDPSHPSHLMLRVGDILSIIEMISNAQNETTFWKAKLTISNKKLNDKDDPRLGFEVGYFPSDCVRLIDDKRLPVTVSSKQKNSSSTARRMTDILRGRVRRRAPVFGQDLIEHLRRTGREVPLILERCCEAIEKQGIVTGIYRQCGIQSNIQRLRAKFDVGAEPDLYEFGQRDIYSVSSLLKQYFRQLPNPLFTFQSYANILKAFDAAIEDRSNRLRHEVESMPTEHFHTSRYLMRHLSRLCDHTSLTDMNAKNLAIVWAPNLFRTPPTLNGVDNHLLNGLNVHTAICSYMIAHADEVFGEEDPEEEKIEEPEVYADIDEAELTDYMNGIIEKSATIDDIRNHSDSRWPRFFRGKSVEGFWKFGRKLNGANGINHSTSADQIKWRRSHSTDASLHASRADSIISFMSKGMDELRDGVRSLRARARSLRPSSRPPPSPSVRRNHSQAPPSPNPKRPEIIHPTDKAMYESITASTVSYYSNDPYFAPKKSNLSSRLQRRNSIHEDSPCEGTPKDLNGGTPRSRKVMFKKEEGENEEVSSEKRRAGQGRAPLCERSSPVEEWSSDSRDSPQLEMSRYDNVSPNGTLNRNRKDIISKSLSTPISFLELQRAQQLFLA